MRFRGALNTDLLVELEYLDLNQLSDGWILKAARFMRSTKGASILNTLISINSCCVGAYPMARTACTFSGVTPTAFMLVSFSAPNSG
jgi:hypothetical protein